MTPQELNDVWLSRNGLKISDTSRCDPIMPFIIMNLVYDIYQDNIRDLECKHMAMKHKKNWIKSYNEMNRRFFGVFNQDQQDEVIDMMDRYEKYMKNHVAVAQVSLMECLNNETFEHQKTLSSCMMARALCHMAIYLWDTMYVGKIELLGIRKCMDRIRKCSYDLMKECYNGSQNIDFNNSNTVHKAMQILCNKTVAWIKKQNNNPQK